MTPQDQQEIENDMVQIPGQSWYGLVVYDLTPEQLDEFFRSADPAQTDPEAMVELCEGGLGYINDRFVDGSHDMLDTSNVPDTQRLKTVADKLEKWRKEWILRTCEFEVNAEAIENYLCDDYIRHKE